MLETIRQLSALASSTISKIYDLMNEYLAAPRKRSAFRREMLKLASGLGLCHHALSHFGKASIGRNYFVSLSHYFAGNCTENPASRRVLLAFTM